MADLIVELYGRQIGTLVGPWRTFDFLPDPGAVAAFGIDSSILSVAIPLTAVLVRARKNRRQNFFRELLPEGRTLTRLAQQARLGEQDVIGLLGSYGRDVAGALQIWDPDGRGEPKQPALEPLTRAGVHWDTRYPGQRAGDIVSGPLRVLPWGRNWCRTPHGVGVLSGSLNVVGVDWPHGSSRHIRSRCLWVLA